MTGRRDEGSFIIGKGGETGGQAIHLICSLGDHRHNNPSNKGPISRRSASMISGSSHNAISWTREGSAGARIPGARRKELLSDRAKAIPCHSLRHFFQRILFVCLQLLLLFLRDSHQMKAGGVPHVTSPSAAHQSFAAAAPLSWNPSVGLFGLFGDT